MTLLFRMVELNENSNYSNKSEVCIDTDQPSSIEKVYEDKHFKVDEDKIL